ncbi:hypothetical protein GIB67_016221 [Kingdonia uniflora]|uniref:Uncharacterized protein n=1 Tax=Kingdonia uniflora TaxID=39325 RepID=A0A7J7LTB4_9MAGN|nr:hypothetical protein GIB67_016221 [Kingdonia uniflora]
MTSKFFEFPVRANQNGVFYTLILIQQYMHTDTPAVQAKSIPAVQAKSIPAVQAKSIPTELACNIRNGTGGVLLSIQKSFMSFMHKVYGWLNSFVTNELFKRESVFLLLVEIIRKQSLTIQHACGFQLRSFPMVYHGAPISYGKVITAKSDKLLEKVQSKVEGWKGKLLSNGGSKGNPLHTLA